MDRSLRVATSLDLPALGELISRSARGLGVQSYRREQIEGALTGAFGVDTQLVLDGTYFAIEADSVLVACGGWSFRRTLFGSDAGLGRDAGLLDPRSDAAKIRAFFVDPAYARQGLGRRLLAHCESEALRRGYTRFELMATLTGVPLYETCGYVLGDLVRYPVAQGVTIEFIPMRKDVHPSR